MSHTLPTSHSAVVEMGLDCGPHGTLELRRISPRAVFAKEPREIPPCYAELLVTIDGQLRRTKVNLTNGFSKRRIAARAMPADDAAPF